MTQSSIAWQHSQCMDICLHINGSRKRRLRFSSDADIVRLTNARIIIMQPSSVGGAAYCVALCPSVCLSVRPVLVYIRTSVTCFRQPCGRVVSFVLFTCQGRIPYGDLSRTSLLLLLLLKKRRKTVLTVCYCVPAVCMPVVTQFFNNRLKFLIPIHAKLSRHLHWSNT